MKNFIIFLSKLFVLILNFSIIISQNFVNTNLSGVTNTRSNDLLKNLTIQSHNTPSLVEISETSCPTGSDCVPYFLCLNNVIIKDGVGIFDIRLRNENAGCSDTMEICCSINNVTNKPFEPTITSQDGCGLRNNNGVGIKVIGTKDNETQFGEFPWMVAILKKLGQTESPLIVFQCGGSLINPLVVLTAGHCVSGLQSNSLIARAGEWDLNTVLEPLPYQERDIAQIIVHENFQKSVLQNDIALLFLQQSFDLTANVKPICLPPSNINFDYTRCYATGWGKDKFGSKGRPQTILKKIELPVVPHSECQSSLRTTRLGKYFELHDSFLCAGGEEDVDTCKGDGGSPLVCPIVGSKNNRFYQAGIVSWGIGCGNNNIPGVYAKIGHFRNWIDQMILRKGLNDESYTVK